MVFFGRHGVKPAEKELGQRFVVDLEVSADLQRAGQSDEIANTLDYARLYRIVRDIVEGPSLNLLEAVAQRIADRVLQSEPLAREVRVRVAKPGVPLPGAIDQAVVEIVRSRG